MRPARRAALAAVLALGLAACASVPRPRIGIEPPLAGRLLVKVASEPARSLSATFELDGDATRGRLALSSPLGTTLGEAHWAPGEARLVASDGVRDYPDLEALAADALGERIPIAALFDWLRGRPAPALPWQPLPGGEPGFMQAGWRVGLARLAEGWVEAQRDAAPAVTVRARLDPTP